MEAYIPAGNYCAAYDVVTDQTSASVKYSKTHAVEDYYASNMYEAFEFDYLICKELMSYVRLLLSGKIKEYLKNKTYYNVVI